MSNERIEFIEKPALINNQARLLYVSSSKYEGDWHSQLHSHHFTELFYVTKGCGGFKIGADEFNVQENDFVIINPNTMHTEVSRDRNPLEYIVIAIDGISFEIPEDSLKDYISCNYANYKNEILFYLNLMVKESQAKNELYDDMCQQLMQVLLINILRLNHINVSLTQGKTIRKEIFMIKNYIDRNYHKEITLDTLAEKTHMNKFYLAHEFKNDVGVSPISYLLQRRIYESKYLLRDTDLSISQISTILGFSSLSYFAQAFKKSTNFSPLQYRKNHQKYNK